MTGSSDALVTKLVGVYDADGGVAGEAKYVVGHLLGRDELSAFGGEVDQLERGLQGALVAQNFTVPAS